jgi:hypothetical protein
LFTVEVIYNELFCGTKGSKDKLMYECCSVDYFDNYSRETWSLSSLNENLKLLSCERDGRLHVYWLLPGKCIMDGLVCIESQAGNKAMINASMTEKRLILYIDHSNFLKGLREDLLVRKPHEVVVEEGDNGAGPCKGPTYSTASISSAVALVEGGDNSHSGSDDSSEHSEFYDSDFMVEEGDDNLFAENIDKIVMDYNENKICEENDDDSVF